MPGGARAGLTIAGADAGLAERTRDAGATAAIDGKRRGLVDHWLHPIRELLNDHAHELGEVADNRARLDRLCELNVMRQVKNVASDVFVQEAWARGQPLAVHGWVYSLSNGLITDLNVTVARP